MYKHPTRMSFHGHVKQCLSKNGRHGFSCDKKKQPEECVNLRKILKLVLANCLMFGTRKYVSSGFTFTATKIITISCIK
jgi:hypothetical protein